LHIVCAFVVIGTMFYVPISAVSTDTAVEFGYQTQELFFRYGCFFVFAMSTILEPIRKTDMSKIALFFIAVLITALMNGFDVATRRVVLNTACAVIFFKAVSDHFSFVDFKAVSWWMFVIVAINLIMCIQQYFKIDPLFSIPQNMGAKDAVAGFMRIKVHLGTLLAVISPIVFYAHPLLAFASIPMLCFANSSAAVFAYVASIGLVLFFKLKRRVAIALFTSILLAGAFYIYKFDMPGGQFEKRFMVWNAVYSFALKGNPIYGAGAGSFAKLNVKTIQENGKPEAWLWAHNEYLQSFYEFGIIGVAFILFYIKDFFKSFIKSWDDSKVQVLGASVLSVLIISFLHFPFHISRLAIPCLFVMALFQARVKDLKSVS